MRLIVIDAEATAHSGATPHDRTKARTMQRNGGGALPLAGAISVYVGG